MTPAGKTPWRWAVLTLVAVVLVYPVVRRLGWKSGTPSLALKTAIDSSFKSFNAGRYDDAIAFGRAGLRIDPDSADDYNNIAAAYAELGNWDPAIQNIRQALRINPEYQLAKNNLAWYAREKMNGPPAPSIEPRAGNSMVNASLLLYQAGKYRECIHIAKEALRLDPNSAVAYTNIAAAYSAMGMWSQAIAAAQQAMRIDPSSGLARNNLTWAVEQRSGNK
jgi:tetratricopeptide (TPR) repeat protein